MKKNDVLSLIGCLILVCIIVMVIFTLVPNMWDNMTSILIMGLLGLTLLGAMRYYSRFDTIKARSFDQIKRILLRPATLMINILCIGCIVAFVIIVLMTGMPFDTFSIILLVLAALILSIFFDVTMKEKEYL